MPARLGQVLYWAACAMTACASVLAISACMPTAQQPSPEHITIAVDKEGNFSWNGEPVSCEEIERRLNALPRKTEVASPARVPCSEIEKIKTGH